MTELEKMRQDAEEEGDDLALRGIADAMEEAGDPSLNAGLRHPLAAELVTVPHLDGIIGWGWKANDTTLQGRLLAAGGKRNFDGSQLQWYVYFDTKVEALCALSRLST